MIHPAFTHRRVLIVIAALAWAATVLYLSRLDLITSTHDEITHIISGRLIVESLTPGFSQVGFWAPLLHLLIMPLMVVPILASSGVGASIALLPFGCVSVVLVYELCVRLGCSKNVAFFAASLFLFNPYILFFSGVPMAEILLIVHVLACAYYFDKWMCTRSVGALIYAGVAVSLASMSRFEGFLLIPITLCLVLLQLWRWKVSFNEGRAMFLLFFIPAVFGFTFIMVYSYVYSEQVLAYGGYSLSGGVSINGNGHFDLPFEKTAATIFYAARYMMPVVFVVFSLPVFIIASLVRREYLRLFSIGSILASPIIFVYFVILFGKLRMVTPETANVVYAYENVRYALTWIGFPMIACALAMQLLARIPWKIPKLAAMTILASLMLFAETVHTYRQYFISPFTPLLTELAIKDEELVDFVQQFNEQYDYGRILTLRYSNDFLLIQTGLTLDHFVLEYNYRHFEQAVHEPWVFVRWVVIPEKRGSTQSLALLQKLKTNKAFIRYFELVRSTPRGSIYRLRDTLLREEIAKFGYSPQAFPSLSSDMTRWDPALVYSGIQRNQAP